MPAEKFVYTSYLIQCDLCTETYPDIVENVRQPKEAGWTVVTLQGEFTTVLCPRHTAEAKEPIQ